jgi:histidinol-phosphate/aromatic aminotransferase/cobyric acid decarboxylase-like protein
LASREAHGAPARLHGGPDAAELRALGVEGGPLIDFSVNVNPYGPAPAVAAAARGADIARYPEAGAAAVRAALASRWGCRPEGVLFAHGATEILWALARHLARAGDPVLVVEPAFSELRTALEASGASAVGWRPAAGVGASLDPAEVVEAMARARASACYLATPTSPLGQAVPSPVIEALASSLPRARFVLDESFLALSDHHADAEHPLPSNVLRLRSLTKEHAIPGLRAGYLLAEPALVAALDAARPSWSTSAPAQAAALAAIPEDSFVAESRRRLAADREALRSGLASLGVAAWPSSAPYLAFPAAEAARLRRRLLAKRILVRDCASFGLPGVIRVAARPAADRGLLLAALAEELQ